MHYIHVCSLQSVYLIISTNILHSNTLGVKIFVLTQGGLLKNQNNIYEY